MRHDPLLAVRGDMLTRIEALLECGAEMGLEQLCDQLEAIRSIARIYGFDSVERLASLLESVIAYHGHRQVAATYLDLMREAARGNPADHRAAHVFLAAAALRGCR